jgi:hypothetical protein
VIAHISGSEVERRIYEKLRNKESVQSVLLEMMKEMLGERVATPVLTC